jgi:hypothetical protein
MRVRRLRQRESARRLARRPSKAYGSGSAVRLNALIRALDARVYLEIGIAKGKTLGAIAASHRCAVDPSPQIDLLHIPRRCEVHLKTSDEFFAEISPSRRFDAVFVDGLHEFRQSYRDCVNSLSRLAPGGFILVDDVVPIDAIAAIPDLQFALREADRSGVRLSSWMGDVYKTAMAIATLHPELSSCVVTGDGWREQLLVWRGKECGPIAPAHSSQLDELEGLSPERIISAGLSDVLAYCELADAISLVRSSA